MLWETQSGIAILKMSSSPVTYQHMQLPNTSVSDDDIPQGMHPWVKEDASIWQRSTSHHVPSYRHHTRASPAVVHWPKETIHRPCSSLGHSRKQLGRRMPKARKASAGISSQCLQFRASIELFSSLHPILHLLLFPLFPSLHTFARQQLLLQLSLPLHHAPVWVAAAAASSLTLSKDSAVTGTVCSPCVRTQPDPTETKVFAHTLPVLGVGFSHQSHSLSPCNEWQEPCKIVCGVWRFERTQHRSYYCLLLMLSAE